MAQQKTSAAHQQPKGKPRGKPFPKGKTGNPAGRPPGIPNKVTLEAKEAAAEIVDNPDYRAKLLERMKSGKVAPAVEAMLWAYAKGKPKEQVEHSGEVGYRWLTDSE